MEFRFTALKTLIVFLILTRVDWGWTETDETTTETFPVEVSPSDTSSPGGKWDFQVNRTGLIFEWNNGSTDIMMQLRAAHHGWLGFGFCSPRQEGTLTEGMMQQCDLVIVWVGLLGQIEICDFWSEANGLPSKDATNNYILVNGEYSNGWTRVKFTRKLNTLDGRDANLTLPQLFSWAHSEETMESVPVDKACDMSDHVHKYTESGIFDEHAILIQDPMRQRESDSGGRRGAESNCLLILTLPIAIVTTQRLRLD